MFSKPLVEIPLLVDNVSISAQISYLLTLSGW